MSRVNHTTRTHLESELEAFFYKRVKTLGGEIVKLMPTQTGIPDRLVFLPGGSMHLVELKMESNLSPLQRWWRTRLGNLGTKVVVLSGRAEVIQWLRECTEANAAAVNRETKRRRMEAARARKAEAAAQVKEEERVS